MNNKISFDQVEAQYDGELFEQAIKEEIKKAGGTKNIYKNPNFLQDIIKKSLESFLKAELDEHLGYEKSSQKPKDTANRRNGKDSKTVRGDFGEIEITTPRDRDGTFQPTIIPKGNSSMEGFTGKILSLYAKGMTTRDIENHVCEIYGIDISPQFISRCVEDITSQVTQWQNRPLDSLYPIVYVDGLFVSCKSGENKGPVVKKCVHIVLGITVEGRPDILGLWIQDTEAARYWLDIFNDIKARGVRDIIIICGDGLNGLPSAAAAAFPRADVQLCVVHQIRNSTKFVACKDRKAFCQDMKKIYTAPTVEAAELALLEFEEIWGKKYPHSVDSWKRNWEKLVAFMKYPVELRSIIYTTNRIESLNAQLRKNIQNRKVFPTENSLMAILFLNIQNFTKKWTAVRDWRIVMNQLALMHQDIFRNHVDNN